MHDADLPLARRWSATKSLDFSTLSQMILNKMMMLRVANGLRLERACTAIALSLQQRVVARGQQFMMALWADLDGRTLARRMHQASATTLAIDYVSPRSILTATILGSERHPSAPLPVNASAFGQCIQMSDANAQSVESRIAGVVQRLLAEHSIEREVAPDEDLRLAGLSSLDMVSLVLSIEDEFDFMIPESSIMPANFRSISTIGRLVGSLHKKA